MPTTAQGLNGYTTTISTTDNPGTNKFIVTPLASTDWRSPSNDALWQGLSSTNNPCPTGYRLPTMAEITALFTAEGITNTATAFSSSLKFSQANFRDNGSSVTNTISSLGFGVGLVTSSDIVSGQAGAAQIYPSNIILSNSSAQRSYGLVVRCIKP